MATQAGVASGPTEPPSGAVASPVQGATPHPPRLPHLRRLCGCWRFQQLPKTPQPATPATLATPGAPLWRLAHTTPAAQVRHAKNFQAGLASLALLVKPAVKLAVAETPAAPEAQTAWLAVDAQRAVEAHQGAADAQAAAQASKLTHAALRMCTLPSRPDHLPSFPVLGVP